MITVKSKALITKILLLGVFSLFVDAPQAVEIAEEFEKKHEVPQKENFHDVTSKEVEKAEEVTKSQENPQNLHDAIFESFGLVTTASDKKLEINHEKKIRHLIPSASYGWYEYFRRLFHAARLYQITRLHLKDFSDKLQKYLDTVKYLDTGTCINENSSINIDVKDFKSSYLESLRGSFSYSNLSISAREVFEKDLQTQFEKIMAEQEQYKRYKEKEGVEIITGWGEFPNEKFQTNFSDGLASFSEALFKEYPYWYFLKFFNKYLDDWNKPETPTIAQKVYSFFTTDNSTADNNPKIKKNLRNINWDYLREVSDRIFYDLRNLLSQMDYEHAKRLYGCLKCRPPGCQCGWRGCIPTLHMLPLKRELVVTLASLKNEDDISSIDSGPEKGSWDNMNFKLVSQESLLEFLGNLYGRGNNFYQLKLEVIEF